MATMRPGAFRLRPGEPLRTHYTWFIPSNQKVVRFSPAPIVKEYDPDAPFQKPEDAAATLVQKHFRGFSVRRKWDDIRAQAAKTKHKTAKWKARQKRKIFWGKMDEYALKGVVLTLHFNYPRHTITLCNPDGSRVGTLTTPRPKEIFRELLKKKHTFNFTET